ncbi:MAG TPA: cupin domain-containing protein, partial [Opitutus sp.]|nr:cupin domain-containing protein [Opitutus sp.]
KELSIALGAKRNTPSGLGGHPFDLELSKLRPLGCGSPFHSHAAEWELFMILSGTATVRADAATHTLVAGDVVLHPPGEAHQITNASATEELVFYLVADNAPVEYWHYPDTNKWGLRSPRKFFRMEEREYWADEE